jgi:transporter family protein
MSWQFWAFLSALFAGLTAVLAKAGVSGIDSNLATAIRTAIVLLLSWAIVFWNGIPALSEVPRTSWVFLIFSGIATGASWLCYFRALQLGDASKVAPIDKLSVVVAIILAVVFLGEKLTWQQSIGAGLIVAGALIIAWK